MLLLLQATRTCWVAVPYHASAEKHAIGAIGEAGEVTIGSVAANSPDEACQGGPALSAQVLLGAVLVTPTVQHIGPTSPWRLGAGRIGWCVF